MSNRACLGMVTGYHRMLFDSTIKQRPLCLELVDEVLEVVRRLASEGMTLIMVTHEMRFAREVSDTLIFMHQGKVHEMGSPEELFSNPRTPELSSFVKSVA